MVGVVVPWGGLSSTWPDSVEGGRVMAGEGAKAGGAPPLTGVARVGVRGVEVPRSPATITWTPLLMTLVSRFLFTAWSSKLAISIFLPARASLSGAKEPTVTGSSKFKIVADSSAACSVVTESLVDSIAFLIDVLSNAPLSTTAFEGVVDESLLDIDLPVLCSIK